MARLLAYWKWIAHRKASLASTTVLFYKAPQISSEWRSNNSDLEPTVAPCKIQFDAPEEIQIAADRSILVGLIINELVSNAGKYAYPDCPGGSIWVRLFQSDENSILVSVWDEGVGLPPGFDPTTSKRLGARLV